MAVAVMGVAGALLALVIDRRREFGLVRFFGASAAQVRRIVLLEAGFLGLLANLAGLALGVLLSLLLIFVINKQSFGWTIQLLAGIYPARVAGRLKPFEVVHEE